MFKVIINEACPDGVAGLHPADGSRLVLEQK